MTTTPASNGYENALAHFQKVLEIYQPQGAFSPDPKVRYTFVKRRQHINGGMHQPYLAIRAIRKEDGKELYLKPCTVIRFEDGTASVWWYGGKSRIFAIDNAILPSGY